MPLVPRVLAPRAVGQNQVVAGSSQQPCDGLLDVLERQRGLVGSVIEIRHLTIGSQSLQDPTKLRRAVWINCPA
jgi:hypothetical protein